MINNLANYLSGVNGDFWGFIGIALAYICTGISELFGERKIDWRKASWFVPGAIFIYLAIKCLIYRTVKVVDAGVVLGYLGIGAGLCCTAWTMHAKRKEEMVKWVVSWILMVVGILFTFGAAVIMMPSGLVTTTTLIFVIIVTLIFSGIYKIWLMMYRQ